MNTLYLLEGEQKLFQALPAALQEGWQATPAVLAYEDSYERMQIRCAQMTLVDESLAKIRTLAQEGCTPAALVQAIENMDLSNLPEADMRELLYGLGPDILGLIVQTELRKAQTDEDLKQAASYSTIRHLFFGS